MTAEGIGLIAIVIAALIGAATAAIVWKIARSVFGWQTSRTISLGIVALGMAIAIPTLTRVIIHHGSPTIRSVSPMPDLLEEAKQDPFIERVLSDHPDLSGPLEERLKEAYKRGGRESVSLEEIRFGQEIAISPQFNYFVRARSRDLVRIMSAQRDVLVEMAEKSPELCHPFLFGVEDGDQETLQRIEDAVPDALSTLTIEMIVNAYEEVPYYDRAAGRQVIYHAQTKTTLLYGDNGMALLAGEKKPANREEQEMVCLVFISVLTSMLDEGEVSAALGFRAMFDAG